jgi:hypothetical protein
VRARLWLRVTVALIRGLEGVVRRLGDAGRVRCPGTGRKHVFVRINTDDASPACAYCTARPY